MTGNKENFHTFEEFTPPVPVYGVGKALIHAYGKGQVILESKLDLSTHSLPHVWYVPGIQESILSAFNTRFNNLKTTMDNDENFIITSKVPGSSFSATTTYNNKMAVLPTIRTLKPTTIVFTTTSANPSTDNSNSSPESPDISKSNPPSTPNSSSTSSASFMTPSTNSDSSPNSDSSEPSTISTPNSPKQRLIKDRANGLLIHDRLFHPSKERLRQLGIKFNSKNCDFCILGKQTRSPFTITISDKTEVPLLRVSSDICGQINPISFGNAKYVLTKPLSFIKHAEAVNMLKLTTFPYETASSKL